MVTRYSSDRALDTGQGDGVCKPVAGELGAAFALGTRLLKSALFACQGALSPLLPEFGAGPFPVEIPGE